MNIHKLMLELFYAYVDINSLLGFCMSNIVSINTGVIMSQFGYNVILYVAQQIDGLDLFFFFFGSVVIVLKN